MGSIHQHSTYDCDLDRFYNKERFNKPLDVRIHQLGALPHCLRCKTLKFVMRLFIAARIYPCFHQTAWFY